MAIPKGPGQQESTGDGQAPEQTGTYKDPISGKQLTVTMPAGADALVRLGWELVDESIAPQVSAK